MLGINPLLKFGNGEIYKQGTVRTYKKAFLETVDLIKNADINPIEYEFHVVEFDAKNSADELSSLIKKYFPEYEVIQTPISINVCAHCGPGTVGFGYCKKV